MFVDPEKSPLSPSPASFDQVMRERRDAQALNAVETRVEAARNVSPEHPDLSFRERWAWYLFDFGAQPFATAIWAVLVPIILEELAWNAGSSNPLLESYPPCADRNGVNAHASKSDCFVYFGGRWVTPVNFAMWTQTISVLLQMFVFLALGALGDRGYLRKKLLLGFAAACTIFSIMILVIYKPQMYIGACVLAILANLSFGTTMLFHKAYLPILADAHPTVRAVKTQMEQRLYELELSRNDSGPSKFEDVSLKTPRDSSAGKKPQDRAAAVRDEASRTLAEAKTSAGTFMSITNVSVANAGGALALGIVTASIYFGNSSRVYDLQLAVAGLAMWFLIFALVLPMLFLQSRPGVSIKKEETALLVPWKRIYKSIIHAPRLLHTYSFLFAWFLYADGVTTVGFISVIIAKAVHALSSIQVLTLGVIIPAFGILGNFFFYYVVTRIFKFTNKSVLLILIGMLIFIPVYGLIGLALPNVEAVGGMRTVGELYFIAGYFGMILGPLQSYSRITYSELIPPGMESEFFAWFSMTDRGSSLLGPWLVMTMAQSLGDLRYGFIIILLMFTAAVPFLAGLDMTKGRKAAREYSIKEAPQ
jgi:UMF1 family MFS transporter